MCHFSGSWHGNNINDNKTSWGVPVTIEAKQLITPPRRIGDRDRTPGRDNVQFGPHWIISVIISMAGCLRFSDTFSGPIRGRTATGRNTGPVHPYRTDSIRYGYLVMVLAPIE